MTTDYSLKFAAIQNGLQNKQVGAAIDNFEAMAVEYAKQNGCSKSEAMTYLQEQYQASTGNIFLDEVKNNTENVNCASWAGFLDGLDLLNLNDVPTTQQALNDLADVDSSFGEKAGETIGGGVSGSIAGAIIGGVIGFFVGGGPAGALLGAKIGAGVGAAAGGLTGLFKANAEDETYDPDMVEEEPKAEAEDTSLSQYEEEVEEELEEENV
jgi:hypothetical protein